MGALALWTDSLGLWVRDLTAPGPAGLMVKCILGNSSYRFMPSEPQARHYAVRSGLASLVQHALRAALHAANGAASVPSSALKLASYSYKHPKACQHAALSSSMLGQLSAGH